MTPIWIIAAAVFVLGLCIGSFLNVCIYRLPAGQSIVSPGSRCPACGTAIRPWDNLPLVSFLLLRGRCRHCGRGISPRYPLVELLSGLLALACLARFGPTAPAAVAFAFGAAMLVVTFIDLDHRIIPDRITLPGIALFGVLSLLMPQGSWVRALMGILVGGGSLWSVAWIYSRLTGKEGMGGGDIKLLAMIGALVGWPGVLFTIFAASALGTAAGLAVMRRARENLKMAIPFGPFLAAGSLIYLFYGPELISLYLNLLR
jgi:leader peptidase (prepilin peptidase)/N-methyltransferase